MHELSFLLLVNIPTGKQKILYYNLEKPARWEMEYGQKQSIWPELTGKHKCAIVIKIRKRGIVMRKILVVIDMQKDFIDGALGTKEAQAIVKNVVRKIGQYEAKDIYATRDTHMENYLETSEGKHLPVPHCIEGTPGWELHEEIADALKGAVIINKPTFGSIVLADLLQEENDREELEIELVGLCTDICVVSNALLLKAAMPEIGISVDASCCAGVTPESHEAALTTMKMCQIEII